MGISRWGEKVDKALTEPAPEIEEAEPLSASELVSQEARRIEIQDESSQIRQWVERRLGRNFPGIQISCRYDWLKAWYVVEGVVGGGPKQIRAEVVMREEEIAEHATDVTRWMTFLSDRTLQLKEILYEEYLKRGGKPPLRPGLSYTANGSEFSASMSRMDNAFKQFGQSADRLTVNMSQAAEAARKFHALQDATQALEVQEAMKSIKQTIADQQKKDQ